MSLVSKFKNAPDHMLAPRSGSRGLDGVGITGFAVDKVERYGGSALLGYLKAKHRDNFAVRGIGGDVIVGVVGLIGGSLLNIFSRGNSEIAPHLERLGDVGLQAHFLQWGAEKGADHAGYSTKVVHEGAQRQLPAQQSVVGAIPAAKAGTVYLSDQDIMNALRQRR